MLIPMHKIKSKIVPALDFNQVHCIKGYSEISNNYSPYLSDESKLTHQGADYLFFPVNEMELSAIFKEMAKRGVKITISGARTGLVGGAVPPGGAIMSLEKFNKILGVRYDNFLKEWVIRAECGVRLADLNKWAMEKNFPDLHERGSDETSNFFEQYKADKAVYFYPPDPTEMGATLGGTVSTNASGPKTFRYGPTRNWVRWIHVMLPSGEVLEIPRSTYFAKSDGEFTVIDSKGNEAILRIPKYTMPLTKNTAGIFSAPNMDLIDLFIGSEGIFGAITGVEVALQKWEESISIVQFFPSDDKAVDFVISLRNEKSMRPDFIEFYSSNAIDLLRNRKNEGKITLDMPPIPDHSKSAIFFDLICDKEIKDHDFSRLEKIVSMCGSSLEWSWVASEQKDLDRFRNFRHILPETVNNIIAERKRIIPELHKLGTDLAVPDPALKEIWGFYQSTLNSACLEWLAFGHIGNNHIHLNIFPRSEKEMQTGISIYKKFSKKAVELGGTVSAEHGIGKIKKEFLHIMFSDKELNDMKTLKLALDPGLMINPGNILDI